MGSSIVLTLVINFFLWESASGTRSVVLDKDTDMHFNWRVNGQYEYYATGDNLHILHDVLPEKFDYSHFKYAQGIWAVLSDMNNNNAIENASAVVATFGFLSAAQLIASVDITYCVYGGRDTNITIRNAADTPPLFTIRQSDPVSFLLVRTHIPINPTSRFVVECNVHGPHDFIFIDAIRANYLETTTSPRPRTTVAPTAKPVVGSAGYNSITSFAFMCSILPIILGLKM